MTRPRGDGGSILPLVPVMIVVLLLLGGLVVDGARVLNARGAAQAYAEEAARAGASAVDLTSPTLRLDTAKAQQRVRDYCAAALGHNGSVEVVSCHLVGFGDATTCGGATARIVVNTEVRLRIRTSLLNMVRVSTLDATGAAHARPYEGITAADAC